MMRNSDFVAFILTHGRANHVLTYNTLRNCGYSGRVVLIVDDEDSQQAEYVKRYGKENVFIFSKAEERKHTDSMDNFPKMNCILYARNVCFRAAEELGYRYFIELDDDYTSFSHRYKGLQYKAKVTRNLDNVFDLFVDFLRETPATTIAFAQGGDFIGGGGWKHGKPHLLEAKGDEHVLLRHAEAVPFYGKDKRRRERLYLSRQARQIVLHAQYVRYRSEDDTEERGRYDRPLSERRNIHQKHIFNNRLSYGGRNQINGYGREENTPQREVEVRRTEDNERKVSQNRRTIGGKVNQWAKAART